MGLDFNDSKNTVKYKNITRLKKHASKYSMDY